MPNESIPLKDLGASISLGSCHIHHAAELSTSAAPSSSEPVPPTSLSSSPPALTLNTVSSPGSEILLSPLPPRLSKADKGKGKATEIASRETRKEIWDVENPFEGSAYGQVASSPVAITSYQPPKQEPMSKRPAPKPPELLPPERSRLGCLDGPTPKDPEHSYGRYLGELCIGAVLCQCCPCLRQDPKQY